VDACNDSDEFEEITDAEHGHCYSGPDHAVSQDDEPPTNRCAGETPATDPDGCNSLEPPSIVCIGTPHGRNESNAYPTWHDGKAKVKRLVWPGLIALVVGCFGRQIVLAFVER
jgi:hypothetical protein